MSNVINKLRMNGYFLKHKPHWSVQGNKFINHIDMRVAINLSA